MPAESAPKPKPAPKSPGRKRLDAAVKGWASMPLKEFRRAIEGLSPADRKGLRYIYNAEKEG